MHIRKNTKKLYTVQPKKIEKPPAIRQKSIGVTSNELFETPAKDFKDFKNFPEVPRTDFIKPEFERKTTLKQKIEILDQMGFGSLLETKAECGTDYQQLLKRRFSIGITDFWMGQDREKFLREKGYLDIYKKLQEQTIKNDIKRSSSIIKPDLPYIMDKNTRRRGSMCNDVFAPYQVTRSANIEQVDDNLALKNKKFDKKLLEPINKLMGKCNELLLDTKKFKKNTEKLKVKLREEYEKPKKPKISKGDKCRISYIVESLT